MESSETAQMEDVEPPLVLCVRRPGLASVQKSVEHAGLVYAQLGVFSQLTVLPDSLAQSGHNSSGLGDPGVYFFVQAEGAGYG